MHRSVSSSSSAFVLFVALGLVVTSSACGSSSDGAPSGGSGTPSGGGADGGAAGNDAASGTPVPLPDGVTAVPLQACVPLVYSADVTIGAQDFRLIVDTGSTSLGVAGSSCTNCSVSPLYTPGTSAVDQKVTASSQFGSGSWDAEVFQDDVGLKPSAAVPVKLAAITSQTGFFQSGSSCGGKPYQGLVGFGQPQAAVKNTNAFFDQLVATKQVPDVFATSLCDDGGTLWLGGYDPNAVAGEVQYTPFATDVLAGYYYAIDLSTVTVAGTDVAIPSSSGKDSVVDTGTSAFLLNDTAYQGIAKAIGADPGFQNVFGAGSQWFDTSTQGVKCAPLKQTKAELDAALPPMTLKMAGGVEVKAVATESYLMPYPGVGWCNALVSTAGQSFPLASILGAPILRSSVVVVDRAKKQVGFAPHKACATAKSLAGAPFAPATSLVTVKPRLGQAAARALTGR